MRGASSKRCAKYAAKGPVKDSVLAMLKPTGAATPTTTAASTTPTSTTATTPTTEKGEPASSPVGHENNNKRDDKHNDEGNATTKPTTEEECFEKDFGSTLRDLFRDVDRGVTAGILQNLDKLKVDDLAEQLPQIFPEDQIKPQDAEEKASDNAGPKSKLVEELEAASSSDWRFNMQGVLGRLWADAKKQDADLNAKYQQCGRSYEKQREFRAEWAKAQYDKIRVSKKFEQRTVQAEFDEGTYLPFDCIVDAEGGPMRRAAVKAALSYVMACLQMNRKGVKCGPVPWIRQNGMTQRMEFLYLKKGYSSRFSSAWSTTQEQFSEGAQNMCEQNNVPEQSPMKAILDGRATPKGKAKATNAEVEDEKKKAQKRLQSGFKKLSDLRMKLATALTAGNDIASRIERDPKWEWAKGNMEHELRKALRGGDSDTRGSSGLVQGVGLRHMAPDKMVNFGKLCSALPPEEHTCCTMGCEGPCATCVFNRGSPEGSYGVPAHTAHNPPSVHNAGGVQT